MTKYKHQKFEPVNHVLGKGYTDEDQVSLLIQHEIQQFQKATAAGDKGSTWELLSKQTNPPFPDAFRQEAIL